MKTKLIIFLGLISFAFTACDLNSASNSTPQIAFVNDPTTNHNDTLIIRYTDQSETFKLDTIYVGDTVSIRMFISGVTNNLKKFYIIQSTDSVSTIIYPGVASMDSIFLPTSDYTKGNFLMAGNSTNLYFPFKYVAKKASKEARLTFTVVSDANFENSAGSNSATMVLKTPILATRDSVQ